MKAVPSLILAVLAFTTVSEAAAPAGGRVVRVMSWSDLPAPASATIQKTGPEGGPSVLIKHEASKPSNTALFALEKPGVTTTAYAWRGKIRYEAVEGPGYLETWNQFAPNAPGGPNLRAFSRSLGDAGPFAKITGSSPWREFFVPFNAEGAKGEVQKIEFNLVLPGRGEVEISNLELVEFGDAGAMFGAMGGSALPAFGFKWPALLLQLGLGALILLLVIGAVTTVVVIRRRRATEERRMRAMDAG